MGLAAGKEERIPYLDGLRGYSILAVLLDHTLTTDHWLSRHPYLCILIADATLGVRVFFVLSGFLITTLLFHEEEKKGRISIRGFYERRIARIFPAFYLYIGVIAALAAFRLIQGPLASFLAAGSFTWNVAYFWRLGGGVQDNSKVFGHIWTLSIEEQFYLVWPSCLVFFGRRWSRRLAVAVAILLPLTRLIVFFFIHSTKIRNSLLYRTAQDEIVWGVLAAFLVQGGAIERLRNFRYRTAWLIGSLLVIFVLCPALGSIKVSGMEVWLVPTLQGVAIVSFIFWLLSGAGGIVRNVLESWPAVQLGLLSYSLYIWQQPFTQWSGLSFIPFPLNVLLPVVVAILCYRLVEMPLRRRIRLWFAQGTPAHT
jgi:peptidoglycan/LPS O-acetylase OafA/YrhL